MFSKKSLLPAGIIAVGVVVVAVLVLAKPKPVPQPPASEPADIAVNVVEVVPQALRLAVETQGTVKPKREIDLVAQVPGKIVRVEPGFADGGRFEAQQELVQIDDRDYQVALLEARARVADAQQRLAEEEGLGLQAKREWRELGSQSANDLFMRKPQVAAARANLALAEGNVELALLNLERTKVAAPFSGRIKEIHADLGQFVAAGSPIATVYDSTAFEVRLPLTQRQAALIQLPLLPTAGGEGVGAPAAVTIEAEVAGTAYQWPAQLVRADAYVDPGSRTYFVIAEINASSIEGASNSAPLNALLPGLFIDATIEGKTIADVIVLPRSALYQHDKVLSLDAEQQTVVHSVEVLRKSDSHVWVKAPLPKGTLVTTEKQSVTPAGTRVEARVVDIDVPASMDTPLAEAVQKPKNLEPAQL